MRRRSYRRRGNMQERGLGRSADDRLETDLVVVRGRDDHCDPLAERPSASAWRRAKGERLAMSSPARQAAAARS